MRMRSRFRRSGDALGAGAGILSVKRCGLYLMNDCASYI